MKHTLLILLILLPLLLPAQSVKVLGGKHPVQLQYNGAGITIIQNGDTTTSRNMRGAMQRLWGKTVDLRKAFWVTYKGKTIIQCVPSGGYYIISHWQGKPEIGLMSQFAAATLIENHLQELYKSGQIFVK